MLQDKKLRERIFYAAILMYALCIYGSMAVMSLGAGLFVVTWAVLYGKSARADIKIQFKSPLFWPSVALTVTCAWSLVWAHFSGLEFFGRAPQIEWVKDLRKLWHLFFTFILAIGFSKLSEARLKKAVKAWLLFGAASAVLGILQYYLPIYKPMRLPHLDYDTYHRGSGILSMFKGSYHATGFAGFHLSYASIMVFPAMIWLALVAVLYRRVGLKRPVALAGAAALFFFIANILTYSKIAWIAMPLGVVLIAIIGFKGKPRAALIAAVCVACVIWGRSSEVRLRFQGSDTIKERMQVWAANFEMIRQQPLFGVGWHHNSELSYPYFEKQGIHGFASHAHNNFIDQWSTTGVFGLAAFVWWNIAVALMAFTAYRRNHTLLWRSLGLGLVAGWFCFHVNGMTQSNWWDAKVLHQMSWVAALTMELKRRWKA